MKISLNQLRSCRGQYNWSDDPAPDGAGPLARRIGSQLGAIEGTSLPGERYQGIIITRVVSCQPHPDADRLHVCLLDDGGKAEGVERDQAGHVQVVCGAPNVRAGLLVAWLPPGTTVPESYGKEPFVLSARPLRGVVSQGMLASPRELALGDGHEGILEIDGDVAPGSDFAEQYGLAEDVVFDIENKMFTHRPDCFGLMGVAREIAGIQHQAFKSPEWYKVDAPLPQPEGQAAVLPLQVRNEVPELCPRFTAIAMGGVVVGPSPVWLQASLARVGLRPINNIVDATNYLMLLTGQPLHAYDYDKVKALDGGEGATLVVRQPQAGETIKLLNGKAIEPRSGAVMIATGTRLIGVGGVMGGAETEVDGSTTNIIIEAANFDMYSIRRTSMAHGLFTDAVTRFNKGQSPLQTRAVLAQMAGLAAELAGAHVASPLIDDIHLPAEVLERRALHPPVSLTAAFINQRLGLRLTAEAVCQLLANVEFEVLRDGDQLTVTAPFWRTDIEIPEDIVEEVGRLYGFDHLPLELPLRPARPVVRNQMLALKQRVRDSLSKAGANEVLDYSFVHGKLLQKAGQDPADAFKLANALSPDLQYYRLSLTPGLLDKIHPNIKAGYDEFALFEIGKGHNLKHADDDGGLPSEFEMLDLVYAAGDKVRRPGAAFYRAKRLLEALASDLGIGLEYAPVGPDTDYPVARPYDLSRSAMVSVKGGPFLGMVGELQPAVLRNFKLPAQAAAFGIGLRELLLATAPATVRYQPLSRFPKAEQDICLKVPAGVSYRQVYSLVEREIDADKPENSRFYLNPVDIYQRPEEPNAKQITLRLSIASYDKTLRDEEVAVILERVSQAAAEELDAVRV